jgi:hypothetical protein
MMSALRGGGRSGLFVERNDVAVMDNLVTRGHAVRCYDGRYRLPAIEVKHGSGKVKV